MTGGMDVAGFIAGKLRFKGRLAVVAIAISFLVMIIAVAVSAGFRKEIHAGVASLTGDVVLSAGPAAFYTEDDPVSTGQSYMGRIEAMDGVAKITPAVYRAGIVKAGRDIHGVMFKGVPTTDSTMCVRIPSRLASLLRLNVGDPMVTYFVGEKVKVRKFKVSGIYDSLLDTEGSLVVYAPIADLQRLNDWDEDQVNAMEILLDGNRRSRAGLEKAAAQIGEIPIMYAEDDDDILAAVPASAKYSQLFDWLDLIDFNVVAILLLMTVVAGFNMISGLLILLFRHISTIGTLKSLGMGDKDIASVFLRVSARIVLMGMAAGNALALAFCLIQNSTHLIKLNPENYFVPYVPVSVNAGSVLLADALSFAVIMLLLLIPCLFISKVDPSETMKTE